MMRFCTLSQKADLYSHVWKALATSGRIRCVATIPSPLRGEGWGGGESWRGSPPLPVSSPAMEEEMWVMLSTEGGGIRTWS
jgi:hypothetical protein